jgi:deoxyribodipyrimidine photo-lyase
MTQLAWLRHDLRSADNPVLSGASQTGNGNIIALYCMTPSQWQLQHHSALRIAFTASRLKALRAELHCLGIPLVVLNTEDNQTTVDRVCQFAITMGVNDLHIGEEYGLWERQRDAAIESQLGGLGVALHRYTSQLLLAPGDILNQQNMPYRVFSPFKKAWRHTAQSLGRFSQGNMVANQRMPLVDLGVRDDELGELATPLDSALWPTDTSHAITRLQTFIEDRVLDYDQGRDHPGLESTSQLSPYLACGALSAGQCLNALSPWGPPLETHHAGIERWVDELIWREFYIHLLAQHDSISQGIAFKPETRALIWDANTEQFEAWKQGKTGFPLIDAGMRQLNQTGWMHNRVRMVVASFLTKNLWLDWREGERYFMSQLIDGHLAANNGGWQWAASTGTDAAPYFRVFNPIRQSERFDPQGTYIRQWVNELVDVSAKQIHSPSLEQRRSLGYPVPIVDLKATRLRAIDRFAQATRISPSRTEYR